MAKVPEKLMIPKDERELLEEAHHLASIGVSAVAVLRRSREEHKQGPTPEPEDRAKAILGALEWLTTSAAKRTARPPELTPLSAREEWGVEAAIRATEAGVEASLILDVDVDVEDVLRSAPDRKAGRLADITEVPMLELLDGDRLALFSYRVRVRFLDWLLDCSPDDWKKALKILRGHRRGGRGQLGAHVVDAVKRKRLDGATESEAVRSVAEEGLVFESLPDGSLGLEGLATTGPMAVARVRFLLEEGKRVLRVPRILGRHKRPNRSKPKRPVIPG